MTWFYFAILCALFSAAAAIYEKKILKNEHSIEFATLLSVFAAALSLPVLLIYGIPTLSIQAFILVYVVSFMASMAYILLTKSVRHLSISIVSPLLLFSPVITAILAFIILGERLTISQIVGSLIILTGIYILERNNFNKGDKTQVKYFVYIFIALVVYAITSVIDKVLISKMNVPVLQYLALVQLMIAVNILGMRKFYYKSSEPLNESLKKYGISVFVVALCTVLYRYFQFKAFALVSIGLVVVVKHASSLITTVVGGKLFHEKHIVKNTVATLIMFLGAVLILM